MALLKAVLLSLMALSGPVSASVVVHATKESSLHSDWACDTGHCIQNATTASPPRPVLTPAQAKVCLQRPTEPALASESLAGKAAPAQQSILVLPPAELEDCQAPLLIADKAPVTSAPKLRGAASLQQRHGLSRMLAEWHVYPVPNTSAGAPSPSPLQEVGKNGSVHCCCGLVQLRGTVGAEGLRQLCCCGTIHECCQPSSGSFCDVQNCTAIMVGAITFAAALTALSVSAVWVTRYLQLRQAATMVPVELHVERRPVRRRTRPLPVLECDEAEDGKSRDCPICLEEVTSNVGWTKFSCTHGTCSVCYGKLCEGPFQGAACPLCRTLLVEEIQTEPEAEAEAAAASEEPASEAAAQQPDEADASPAPALSNVLQDEDRQDSSQPLTSAMVSHEPSAVTSSSRDCSAEYRRG